MATTGTIDDSSQQVTRRDTQRERDCYYTVYLTAGGGERERENCQKKLVSVWFRKWCVVV